MSRLASACAATALIATITSIYLWTELRAERVRTGLARERVDQLASTGIAPSSSPGLTSHMPTELQVAVAGPPGSTVGATGGGPVAAMASVGGTQFALDRQELMNDPDYREGLAMSLRISLVQNYPDLAKELGLTSEQARKMMDILVKHQITSMSRTPPYGADDVGRKPDAEISSLIGYAKYRQWQEYQSSMPTRQRVEQLGVALDFVGQPLTDAQRRQLIGTIVAVEKRQSDDARLNATLGDPLAYVEQSSQETNRQILESASSYLSQAQIEALRATQNQELAMTRAMIRARRAQTQTGD
jgi:hypothetical protein